MLQTFQVAVRLFLCATSTNTTYHHFFFLLLPLHASTHSHRKLLNPDKNLKSIYHFRKTVATEEYTHTVAALAHTGTQTQGGQEDQNNLSLFLFSPFEFADGIIITFIEKNVNK